MPALRRGGRGDGVRRGGPGGHGRARSRSRSARHAADRDGRLPAARTSSSTRTSSPIGDRHRGARGLRGRLHRGDAPDQGRAAGRAGLGRRLERLVRVPRQRPGPRGDPLGVPLSRDRGRHGHGHRQRRRAARSTTTSTRTCASWSRTSSSTAGPTPRNASSRSPTSTPRSARAGPARAATPWRGGRSRSTSGSPTPWSRARRLDRRGHRGGARRRRPGPSRSSRGR